MKVLSNWRAVRLWETQLERDLQRRHSLRWHGLLIGTLTLALMWGVAACQRWLGVDSLALRYALTLGAGYLMYLLVLRWWAHHLVTPEREGSGLDGSVDVPGWDGGLSSSGGGSGGAGAPTVHSGGGGDFAGGGASGDFDAGSAAEGLGDVASGALEVAGAADEGAIVVVPVVAVFLIGAAVVAGTGALVLLVFGSEALLAVAIEVAFSYAAARTAVRVSREGWLGAAVRLTWKPLFGALVCAVLLGAALDHFLPQAGSLPEAVRLLRGG